MFYSLRQIVPESKFCHLLYLDVFEQIIPLALDLRSPQPDPAPGKAGTRPHHGDRHRRHHCHGRAALPVDRPPLAEDRQRIALPLARSLPEAAWGQCGSRQRRQQLGVLPLRRLFERVCRPRATTQTPGAFLFGLRLMAIDSTVENVPDTFANTLAFGRPSSQHGSCRLSASAWHLSARVRYPSDRRCPLAPASAQ